MRKLCIIPFAAFLLLMFQNCAGEPTPRKDFSNCKYGTPNAIFTAALKQVNSHNFTLKSQEAVEEVVFENGTKLHLIQSGCDHVKQEFQFRIPGFKESGQDQMLEEALKQLRYLGGLSEQYAVLSFWSDAIAAKRSELKKGRVFEIEANRFVKIDMIPGEEAILIVEFLNK